MHLDLFISPAAQDKKPRRSPLRLLHFLTCTPGEISRAIRTSYFLQFFMRKKYGNLYINMGSLCPASLPLDEPIQPSQWKAGVFLEIRAGEREIEIMARSVKDGRKHARGYYWIQIGKL